ncbi:MAG: ArnT family glycosyltransferase, partial [Anaerolineales bacterium]
VMWAALLLAAVVGRFATDVWGRRGGLFALLLAATDANLIANGGIATRDLLLALWAAAAGWMLWRAVRGRRAGYAFVAGISLGIAGATKYSAVAVAPMLALLVIFTPSRASGTGIMRRVGSLFLAGLTAGLVLWGIYRFKVGAVPGLPWPAPAPELVEGALGFAGRVNRGTASFLFGQRSGTGWWYFFPAALLVKSPLPLLLALGVAIATHGRRARGAVLALLAPALFFLAIAASGNLAIGFRHLLPLVPFLIVLAGAAARTRGHLQTLFTGALAVWAIAGAAFTFPHYLSYFNPLVGGPRNGYRVMVDSSLDWGQDLPALRNWMDANGVDEINLSYFGTALPERYGVAHRALPGFLNHVSGPDVMAYNPYSPEPGWYALSATSLQLGLVDEQPDLYAFFREREPDGRAGYSILIYNVAYPDEEPERVVIAERRVSDMTPEELGIQAPHLTRVKWSSGPVSSTGRGDALVLAGAGPARYIDVRPDLLADAWATRFRAGLLLPNALFDARGLIDSIVHGDELCRAARTPEGAPVALPVVNAAGLELLGIDATLTDELLVTSYWRVVGRVAAPLAEFVHLLAQDGAIASQFDGWGSAARGLEVGDLVLQRSPLAAPEAGVGAVLQLGLYSPQTLQRYEFAEDGRTVADRLLLNCGE